MLQCCLASEHKAANCHVLDGMEYVCCMCDLKDKFLVSGAPRLWAKACSKVETVGQKPAAKPNMQLQAKQNACTMHVLTCMQAACLQRHANCMSPLACHLRVLKCMQFACLMPPCFQATFESKQAKSPCTVRWPTWKQKLLQLSMHAWTRMHMQLLLHFPCGTVCSLY